MYFHRSFHPAGQPLGQPADAGHTLGSQALSAPQRHEFYLDNVPKHLGSAFSFNSRFSGPVRRRARIAHPQTTS